MSAANIDVIFDGVDYIDCPRMLRGLILTEGSVAEARELAASLGEIRFPDRLFVLASGGVTHYVVSRRRE
jgi:hypothetical protein